MIDNRRSHRGRIGRRANEQGSVFPKYLCDDSDRTGTLKRTID